MEGQKLKLVPRDYITLAALILSLVLGVAPWIFKSGEANKEIATLRAELDKSNLNFQNISNKYEISDRNGTSYEQFNKQLIEQHTTQISKLEASRELMQASIAEIRTSIASMNVKLDTIKEMLEKKDAK